MNQEPSSARFVDTLSGAMISNKGTSGAALQIEIPTGGTSYDLIRFVDAWGIPMRYAYDPAVDIFPILTSAGPDKVFDTPDDIINE